MQRSQKESSISPSIDTSHGLYFSLNKKIKSPASHIEIELLLIRHLKTGGLGASKRYSYTAASAQTHLEEQEKLLIANLETGKKLSRDYTMDGYTLKTVFDENNLTKILSTNKCFWNKDFKYPLARCSSIPLQLKWHRQANGDIELQIFSNDRNCQYFVSGLLGTPNNPTFFPR